MRASLFRVSSVTATLLFSSAVLAQATVTPGQVQDTLRKSPQLQKPQTTAPLEKGRTSRPASTDKQKTITVKQFTFAGNSVFSTEELQALVKPYTGRPVSLADIYDAADDVTRYYGERGYGLASVNVPAQKVNKGTVKLEVIEGRLSRITVEGNERHRSSFITGMLDEVQPGEVYQGQPLQRGMRLINELPGLKAKAVVSPGDQYGTSDIVIKAEEQLLNGAVTIDNYGRQQIDEWRLTGQLSINNPFTIEDQIQLLALHTDHSHLRYYYGAYSFPVNHLGTRVTASYGRADFMVKNSTSSGYSNNTKVNLSHPLVRDFSNTLDVTVGVIRNNSQTDFNGALNGGNSLTLTEFGASYNHVYESQAVTQVSTTVSTTFSRFRRAPAGTISHDDQLLRWEVDAFHLQPLFERVTLLTHVNAVYSPDELADSQKFNIGGPQSVRGYPSSEVRGDRGYFGSLTLSRAFFAGPLLFTPRVFVESGRVHNLEFNTNPPASDTLSSTGVGTDIAFAGATFKIDYSRPLGSRTVSDGRTASRIFGALSYAF